MQEIAIGPLFFHWPVQERRDFYFRIADEAPVSTVYLGEVICSKRIPFFAGEMHGVRERLERGGKRVVMSTLSEVTVPADRRAVREACAEAGAEIEVNDASALWWLDGQRFRVGQLFNCYSGETLAFLASKGATDVCLPAELPAPAIAEIARSASALSVGVEVQVYGRASLALSARCYHARAHGRTRDNCLFVCERDADGLDLRTVDGTRFLAVNGIQTLSHACVNLSREVGRLQRMGVSRLRLSPHTGDMVGIAGVFEALVRSQISAEEADHRLAALGPDLPFANGFFHGRPGFERVQEGSATRAAEDT